MGLVISFQKIHPTIHAPCEKALRQTLPGGLGIWVISVLVLLDGAAVLMKKYHRVMVTF